MQFEKVRYESFKKDVLHYYFPNLTEDKIIDAYERIRIPERSTVKSAGYDFTTPFDFYLNGKSGVVIPSGIKCRFEEKESTFWHLKLYNRSSLGINNHIVLKHGTGIIDSDYYNNPSNEGDILIPLVNLSGVGKQFKAGDRIVQGIFEMFGIVKDDNANGQRFGGVGSTGV